MKLFIVLMMLVGLALAAEKYTNKYANPDIDGILQNNRILTNYIKCLLNQGPCTAEGRELKKTLPDALKSGCSKCDDKQKMMADKVINHLKSKRVQDWERLIAKYDPTGEYKRRFEAARSA